MKAVRWLPVAGLGALLALAGYLMLWTTLMAYDDEGYVLYSLRTYGEIGGLYERVFSQYGPFFFVWNRALHTIVGLDFDNVTARWLTLVHWLVAAGACSAIVARLTRSPAATVITLGAVFLHLWPLVSEPSHPGGFICATVALAAWAGTYPRARPSLRAMAIGAAGAALVLTKINVGIFFLAGAGAWWLLSSQAWSARSCLRRLLILILAAIPPLVMHGLIGVGWVQAFALVVGCAAVGVALALPSNHESSTPLGALGWWTLAGITVAIFTLLVVRTTGTSWSGLWDGIVLNPLRHPLAYSAPVRWRFGASALALISLAGLLWAMRLPEEKRRPIVAVIRIAGAGMALASLSGSLGFNSLAFSLSYGLSFAAWYVLPLRRADPTAGTRGWLALLCVLQTLHAYPVAGSQISWGTFLWIPLATLGVHDAWQSLDFGRRRTRHPAWQHAPILIVAAVVLIACVQFATMGWERFRGSDAVRLPGVSTVRVPERHASALRVLATNAAVHADMLFTLPGMMSFNTWTGVPPPTSMNATHWFTLLDRDAQDEIRRRLEDSPRACVIVQRSVYDHLIENGIATESDLTQWLHANFTPAFTVETYEFWIRRNRSIAAPGTMRLLKSANDESPRYKLELIVASSQLEGVGSLSMGQFEGDLSRVVATWDQSNARIILTPLTTYGGTRGPAQESSWPFDAPSLMRVELLTDEMPASVLRGSTIVKFHDGNHRVLAEARLVD